MEVGDLTDGANTWTVTPPLTLPSGTYYVVANDNEDANTFGVTSVEVTEGVNPSASVTFDEAVSLQVKNILDWANVNPEPEGGYVSNDFYQQVGDVFVFIDSDPEVLFDAELEAEWTWEKATASSTYKVVAGGPYVFEKEKEKTLGTQPLQTMNIVDLIPGGNLETCIDFVEGAPDCLFDVLIVLYDSAGEEVDRLEFDVLRQADFDSIPFGTVLQDDDYVLRLYKEGVELGESEAFDITEWTDTTECIVVPEVIDPVDVVADLQGVVRDASDDSLVSWATVTLYNANTNAYVEDTDSNDDGIYRFEELPLGDYILVFRYPGEYETKAVEVNVAGDDAPGYINYKSVKLTPGGEGRIELSVLNELNQKLTPDDIDIAIYDEWAARAMDNWGKVGYTGHPVGLEFGYTTDLDHDPDGEYRTPWALSANTEYSVYICDYDALNWPTGPADHGTYLAGVYATKELPTINGVAFNKIVVPFFFDELEPGKELWNLEVGYFGSADVEEIPAMPIERADVVIVVRNEAGVIVRTAVNPTEPVFTGKDGVPNGTYTVEIYQSSYLVWKSGPVVVEDSHKQVPVSIVDPLDFR